jgi:hypothetical protein
LASGKNVDIDFEIMIDKNRFRDKMLSPHVFSSENKVTPILFSSPSASEKDPSLKNNSKEDK